MSAVVRVVVGAAHPAFGAALAAALEAPAASAEIGAFADGETRVHVAFDVRGAAVVIAQPTCQPVNDNLMVLALMADAIHAAGAARVIAVMPYFGYARQDQRARPGDPRSAQLAGRILSTGGVDELVTLDLHSSQMESILPMPVTHVRSDEAFLPRVKAWAPRDLVVVAPDAGAMKTAQRYAAALGAGIAVVAKERREVDLATARQVLGEVRDRACLIVDDMASTGRTLAGAAGALRQAGAREVSALFTHAVVAPGALERLAGARLAHVLTSDSIPLPPVEWIDVVPIAPLMAAAVRGLLCG